MKPIPYLLLITLAIPVQIHLLSLLPFSCPLDLILVITFYAGYFHGKSRGMFIGAYLGLLTDVLSGELLGTQMFLKTLIGYLAAVFGFSIFSKNLGVHFLLLAIISLLNGFCNLFLLHLFREGPTLQEALIPLILPAAFWNAVIGSLYVFLSRRRAGNRQIFAEEGHSE
ncbi:MAG: rod shape-determining protein MreD [Deltaproteobacteria bacterium]|nr:rod shape-determining protein MreD [Deltaproteobacteria bacterium]